MGLSLTSWILPVLLILVGACPGCASGGSIEPADPMSEKLGQYSDVQLKVSSKEEYPTKFVAALETAILTELRERSMFRSYRSEAEQAPAELRIDLPGLSGELQGRVRDTRGTPLAGIEVLWRPAQEVGLQPNFGTLRSGQTGYHRSDGVFLGGRAPMVASSDPNGTFQFIFKLLTTK